jgi:DUF971 family protein
MREGRICVSPCGHCRKHPDRDYVLRTEAKQAVVDVLMEGMGNFAFNSRFVDQFTKRLATRAEVYWSSAGDDDEGTGEPAPVLSGVNGNRATSPPVVSN